MIRIARFLFLMIAISALCGCNNLPGRPKPEPEVPRPEQVLDFAILYSQNCAGCHGADGQLGPATPLANPEYQALIEDSTLSDIIAKGQKGAMMPAFAESAGGSLSDEQVNAIARGIRARWSKGNVLQGLNAPPYKSDKAGDSARGKQIYGEQCAPCHGAVGGPPGPKGAILNGYFLALVSDQTIRTTAIVGRPDLGMPNWRKRIPGKVMKNQDLNDVVAFVMSQRPATPGQPYGPAQQRTQRTSAATNPTPAKTGGQ